MLKKSYEDLQAKENVRETLSFLRKEIKDAAKKQEFLQILGDDTRVLYDLLSQEDPKVRKNAALLLGDLQMQQAAELLLKAYNNETTLFVKSAYLIALGKLDISGFLPILKDRMEVLTEFSPKENEKKHIDEEIRELNNMITAAEGIRRHTFCGLKEPCEMVLTTRRAQREVTVQEIKELTAQVRRKCSLHPLGVLVYTRDLSTIIQLRTFRELLFPLHPSEAIQKDPVRAAGTVWNSDVWQFLSSCHKENGPFYFRLEIKSRMDLDKRTVFAKRFSAELERQSGRKMINSTRDYEVEIRLLENRDGELLAFLKLYTIPIKRFAYRKHAISASIHPATAAMLVKLAQPYLKENAQILDPFCGVGTMLIERDILVPAKEKYGIDIFGEAIEGARENAAAAGERINFIHRDFFDFRHAYKFDEIISNMPVRGKQSREEMDRFYEKFFTTAAGFLAEDGVIILYSNEEGFVKKQLRLRHDQYKLIKEVCIGEREHFYLYIIGIKG